METKNKITLFLLALALLVLFTQGYGKETRQQEVERICSEAQLSDYYLDCSENQLPPGMNFYEAYCTFE